jgi:hypothetical protein
MARTGVDAREPDDEGPEELERWVEAGFPRDEAERWCRWRFTIARAEAWRREGVREGLVAAQWQTAGATPETMKDWQKAGMDAAEAVRWHELGFALREASRHKAQGLNPEQAFGAAHPAQQAATPARMGWVSSAGPRVVHLGSHGGGPFGGVDPRLMHGYMQRQWTDESAIAWARQGIEAADAYLWHDLGLTAVEAGRLALQGRSPGDVMQEWWRAGIPFEEVAEWIGAGLSAQEALEQRARGISVEQAASLRALRGEEATPGLEQRTPPPLLIRMGPPHAERAGSPPADEDAARKAVQGAYRGMLTADGDDVPDVDEGAGLGRCLREAARRNGVPEGEAGDGATVTADFVRFVNDHEARVSFTVVVGAPRNMHLGGRLGRAILVDGVWKVARETFCEFMQFAGVQCPPRSPK